VFEGYNKGCSYAVLSLVKNFPGSKYLDENTCWQLHHYDELADVISKYCTADIRKEHHIYISDYCAYVRELSKLAEGWKVKEDDTFLAQEEGLAELRLNDIYEKVRFAQIATILANRLENVVKPNDEEESIVLGMSDFDVILKRRIDADEILGYYGCPEAAPYSQVFINSGMSHAIGFIEAKVKVTDDCCLVIQVQGDRYCHGIECEGIANKRGKLSTQQQQFIDFKHGGLKNRAQKADSKVCHYGSNFIYNMQKIQSTHTVSDIVDAICNDINELIRRV
jgi:hypothetical protein